jgi:hypothetical protein
VSCTRHSSILSFQRSNVSTSPLYSRDISDLSSLSNMEVLNLRGNNLDSTESLRAIEHMPHLHTILLSGNPIEGAAGFPDCIFEMCPSLRRVDYWKRAPGQTSEAPANLQNQTGSSQTQSGHSSEAQSGAQTRASVVASADDRYATLSAAFTLQEQALSANGRELSTLCASLSPQLQHASQEAQIPETQLLEQFPYLRLLQLWRKQALDCTTQRTLAEQQLRQSVAAHKAERQQLQVSLVALTCIWCASYLLCQKWCHVAHVGCALSSSAHLDVTTHTCISFTPLSISPITHVANPVLWYTGAAAGRRGRQYGLQTAAGRRAPAGHSTSAGHAGQGHRADRGTSRSVYMLAVKWCARAHVRFFGEGSVL